MNRNVLIWGKRKCFLHYFPKTEGETEPKFNIFAWREKEHLIVVLIPRSKHRPQCYTSEDTNQRLISPGALDMAGILVTARPEDFSQLTNEEVQKIIQEVALPFDIAETIAENIKKINIYERT